MMKFSRLLILVIALLAQLFPNTNVFAQNISWLVVPKYDAISEFSEGIAAVKLNGKWGYINEQGTEIVKPEYEVAYPFGDGVGVLGTADMGIVALADLLGNTIKPDGRYKVDDRFAQFSDGLLLVTNGRKWGYLNKSGTLSISCKYISSQPFSEGAAAVWFDYDGGWYYIKADGSTLIGPNPKKEIYWPMGFCNGQAIVLYRGGMGAIDLRGKEIDGNFPKLTPPDEAVNYKLPTLTCKEGELIFDSKSRAIAFIENGGKSVELITTSQSDGLIKPQGSFILNGKSYLFDDSSLTWQNPKLATVMAEINRYGIIAVHDEPIMQIVIPKDTLKSVFGNAVQLKIQVNNTSSQLADNLSITINDKNIEAATFIESNGTRDILYTLSRDNEAKTEQKSVTVSILHNGLLVSNTTTELIIKDVPSIGIEMPVKRFELLLGETCRVQVNVNNSCTIRVENVDVTLDKETQNISLNPGEKRALIFEIAPGSKEVQAIVKVPNTPAIEKKFPVSIMIITNPVKKYDIIDPGKKI